MRVEKLYLKNFLSYREQLVDFDDGLNVLVGLNAEGKTNLADAVYLSSVARSSRNLKDKDLINFACEAARLKLSVKKAFSTHTIEMYIDKQGKKVLVDGLPIARAGELMGVLNVVLFAPDEMKLVKESPDYRRRFLDITLSQQSKNYFYTLVRYNKLLAQRNKILKDAVDDAKKKDMLFIVTDSIAECAAYIAAARHSFVKSFAVKASSRHSEITLGREQLEIEYQCDVTAENCDKDSYIKLYEAAVDKDVKLQYTTVGVHRDDLKLSVDDVDIRHFGSQGQQRSAVLSMKLAEVEALHEATGETPVLILDDVLSELDEPRKRALFSAVKGLQVIVTCTGFQDDLADEYTRFEIKNKTIANKERIVCKH